MSLYAYFSSLSPFLNLSLQTFSKDELVRVLDAPQLPLHPLAAEADIRDERG